MHVVESLFSSVKTFLSLFLEGKAAGEEEMKAPFQPSLSRGAQKGEDVARETLQSYPQPPESWQSSLARSREAMSQLLANALFSAQPERLPRTRGNASDAC